MLHHIDKNTIGDMIFIINGFYNRNKKVKEFITMGIKWYIKGSPTNPKPVTITKSTRQ